MLYLLSLSCVMIAKLKTQKALVMHQYLHKWHFSL